MERCVDKSFCVILKWKQIIGHLWNFYLIQMHRSEEDNMEGLQPRDSPGSTDLVSAFDYFRDWVSEAEQLVMAIEAQKALSGTMCNLSTKSQNIIL